MNHLLILSLLLLAISCPADTLIPRQASVSEYAVEWEKCAFNREVVKAVESQISSTFGKNITLDGISHDSILGPIAYIRNLADNQPMVVTSNKSDVHPYTIVKANETNDPREAKVTLTNGKETAEISYIANIITQKIEQTIPKTSKNEAQSTNAGNSANTNGSPTPNGADSGKPSSPEEPAAKRSRRILLPNRG